MRGCSGSAIEALDSNLVIEIEVIKASSWFYSERRVISTLVRIISGLYRSKPERSAPQFFAPRDKSIARLRL
jgi:hypothetical protein